MATLEDIPGIEIRPMATTGSAPVRDVIANAFSRFEPMAVAVGQSYEEFQALVGALLADADVQNLTICARLAATGEIIGAMLAMDFRGPVPDRMDQLSPSFAPIGGLLEQLDGWYHETKSPEQGECLHLAMLAVSQTYWGRGVGQNLVMAAMKHAAERGFRSANTFATNRMSQRVFEKLDFAELYSVSYSDYTFAGSRVFASIEADDRTALMAREL